MKLQEKIENTTSPKPIWPLNTFLILQKRLLPWWGFQGAPVWETMTETQLPETILKPSFSCWFPLPSSQTYLCLQFHKWQHYSKDQIENIHQKHKGQVSDGTILVKQNTTLSNLLNYTDCIIYSEKKNKVKNNYLN